jgi:hypothetical protein
LYGARHDLEDLKEFGIDLDQVTRELEDDGVKAFVKSYDRLLTVIEEATRKLESPQSGATALLQRSDNE